MDITKNTTILRELEDKEIGDRIRLALGLSIDKDMQYKIYRFRSEFIARIRQNGESSKLGPVYINDYDIVKLDWLKVDPDELQKARINFAKSMLEGEAKKGRAEDYYNGLEGYCTRRVDCINEETKNTIASLEVRHSKEREYIDERYNAQIAFVGRKSDEQILGYNELSCEINERLMALGNNHETSYTSKNPHSDIKLPKSLEKLSSNDFDDDMDMPL